MSLSRLNHRLPGREANTEVVQGTAEFHHEITDTLFPQADPVFDDATALHTPVDMLDPEPARGECLVGPLLLPCQFLASWLLGRHEALNVGQREGQEAQILQQPTPSGQGIRRGLSNPLIMDTASKSLTEKEDREQGIDQQDIFDRMVFFLAAITRRLFSRVLGADDASFRPVMGQRGDAGTPAGSTARGAGVSSSGTTTLAASVSATPSRFARAASSAGKSTWIH